ncbi:hypothetical protein [Streptomyces sp. NPDC014894]|uniref:hypothetical protein n=1 Tax=unclassified Streptomyces TaxID=2593676 RepID=UPI0036FEF80F
MTLTRGARITTAILCAALALILAGWIARDVSVTPSPPDLWHLWAADGRTLPMTTDLEHALLLLVCATVVAAALRPGLTAGAPAAAGAVTLALWLPGLWVLSSSWAGLRTTDDLRTRALYATFAALALGVGLLITAAAGRRAPAARPPRGVPVAASVLLGAAAGVLAGWEIRTAVLLPGSYPDRFTGDEPALPPLLGVPPGWLTAVTVLLAAAAALAALRPLGLVAGLLVLGAGAPGVDTALHNGLVGRLGELPAEDQLLVVSWCFESAAGAAVLLLLALTRAPAPAPDRRPPPGPPPTGPPPPLSLPPGW